MSLWRDTLAEQQTSLSKTVECVLEFRLWHAQHCSQQGERELVRSLSEASNTPPQAILAKIKTFLLTYDPEHITLH